MIGHSQLERIVPRRHFGHVLVHRLLGGVRQRHRADERHVRREAASVRGDAQARRERVDALAQLEERRALVDPDPEHLGLAARREEADPLELQLERRVLEARQRALDAKNPHGPRL